ncbi:hypothetical protein [Ruegeria halocynthiae]|uniref:hypothetical protein n=1 Tax=Ruegeria halocynthiae TaxID=985054 RepID=UPI001362A7F4|nr:hypothetical protein [Ruegeria halocynthiae]
MSFLDDGLGVSVNGIKRLGKGRVWDAGLKPGLRIVHRGLFGIPTTSDAGVAPTRERLF